MPEHEVGQSTSPGAVVVRKPMNEEKHMSQEDHGPPTISVTVFAPGFTEPKQFTWPKTKKVGEAAAEAAVAFGITALAVTPYFAKALAVDHVSPMMPAFAAA